MKRVLSILMIVGAALLLFTGDASVQGTENYLCYFPVMAKEYPLVVEQVGLVDTGMDGLSGKLYVDNEVIFATYHKTLSDSQSMEPASRPVAPDTVGGIQIYSTLQPFEWREITLTKIYEDVCTDSGHWCGIRGLVFEEDRVQVVSGWVVYWQAVDILDRSTLRWIDWYESSDSVPVDPVLTEVMHGDYKYNVSGNIYDISEGWSRYIGDLDLEGSASCIVRVGDYLYLLTEVGIEIFPLL